MSGVRSPRTLYDLRRAYDEVPDQVEQWVESGAKITRDSIKEALEKLRHDVKSDVDIDARVQTTTDQLQDKMPPIADKVSVPGTSEGLENATAPDSGTDSELRHDVKKQSGTAVPKTQSTASKLSASATGIKVQYKGKTARIVPNTTVKIVVDGHNVPLEVPLAELVFKGTK
jgi:hypothetical protein